MERQGSTIVDILNQSKIDRLAGEIGADNVPVLLDIFLGELTMYIDNLTQQEPSEHDAYMKEICHALKSSAASFGAEALCAYSVEIDSMAKSGALLNIDQDVAKMISLLRETQQRYQELVS